MSEGYRKAALYLHGLSKTDRQWFLGSLPQENKTALETLLEELAELGIPKKSMDLQLLPKPRPIDNKGMSDTIQTLNATSADTIFALMQDEPPVLTAVLLSCYDWLWGQPLRDYFKSIGVTLPICEQTSARLRQCLLQIVEQRLRELPEGMSAHTMLKKRQKSTISQFKRFLRSLLWRT